MRTRNHRIVFYLNDKEFEAFEEKAKRSSRSREAFIRRAIQGRKEEIKAFAAAQGETVNGFINRLINEAMGESTAAMEE